MPFPFPFLLYLAAVRLQLLGVSSLLSLSSLLGQFYGGHLTMDHGAEFSVGTLKSISYVTIPNTRQTKLFPLQKTFFQTLGPLQNPWNL